MALRLWILLAGALIGAAAHADELADFNAAIESFSTHNRAALRYLSADAVGPMSDEIGDMRAAWAAVNRRFGKPPQQFAADVTLYTTTLVDVSMRLVAASMFIQMGSRGGVKNSLDAIRTDLSTLRKANGITTLADCVLEANQAMTALLATDEPGDWSKADDLAAKTAHYGVILTRCEAMADAGTRAASRFRLLVDDNKALLAMIPKAIAARNTAQLRQLLDKLRDNDNALAFHYG